MYAELTISDGEFRLFRDLLRRVAGISLADSKKQMVGGRLWRRVRERGLASFAEYFRLVSASDDEYHRMLDLLTTHETYFFREPKHFHYLADMVLPHYAGRSEGGRSLRVWSAASSTGEEAYSLAMVLMAHFAARRPWEILASDISREVLQRAQTGVYGMERIEGIPESFLQRYFLRGVGQRSGTLRVIPEIRQRVRFSEVNLIEPLTGVGVFDVVFLRNVLIYFDAAVKLAIVARICAQIRPGGWLFIGHAESLNGVGELLQGVAPTIYRRK